MALLITPIDMVEVCRNNPELPLDTLLLYNPYEVPDEGMEYWDARPVAGQVTIGDKTYRIHFGSNPQLRGFKVSRIITVPHADPVVNKWGDWYGDWDTKKDEDLFDWMFKKMSFFLANRLDVPRNYEGEDFVLRLKLFNPMRSAIAFGKISVYQSRKDYDNDRQVAMKPGRALKMMFDMVDDATILEWVDEYLDDFAPRVYKLQVSKEADDFTKAYTGKQVSSQNVSHSYNHKSLSNSCMRYHFRDGHGPNNLPVHPVTAYASGDFSIAWVEDAKGLIAGRVVLYHGESVQAGPIYGACNIAIRQLEDLIDSLDGEFAGHGDWEGAKLVAHEYEGDFIGPYLDIEPRSLNHEGKYLVIDSEGEIDANSYQGILSANSCRCYNCESTVSEDDNYHSEYTGEIYCSDCYYDDHAHCDYTQQDVHVNESILVHSLTNYGEDTNHACESVEGNDAFLCKCGLIWDAGDIVYCDSEEQWISPRDADDYFWSDWDGEYYNISKAEMCLTDEGETVTKQELDDHTYTWELKKGVYYSHDFAMYKEKGSDSEEVCTCEICKE